MTRGRARALQALACCVLMTVGASGAWAQTSAYISAVSGKIPRHIGDTFTMSVTVDNLTAVYAQPQANEDQTSFARNRLTIKMMSVNETVMWDEAAVTSNYWAAATQGAPESGSNDLYKVTMDITVTWKGPLNPLTTIGADGLALRLTYKTPGETAATHEKDVTLARATAIPSDAPTRITVTGVNQSLRVKVGREASIGYSDGSTAAAPAQVAVIVIDPSDTSQTFGGFALDTSDPDNDSATTCVFNSAKVDTDDPCVVCGESVEEITRSYLDIGADEFSSGSMPRVVLTSGTTASVFGLKNDKRYVVAAMYAPDGKGMTQCVSATPVADYTLSELNGEPDGTPASFRCFVATAAYGSALDRHVETLRWFRDAVLASSAPGRAFTRWYYEMSPALARRVAESPTLAAVARGALWAPVMFAGAWRVVDPEGGWEFPTALLAVVVLMMVVSRRALARRRGA